MRKPGNQPSADRLAGQRERAGNDRLAGDDGRDRREQHERENRPARSELKEGIAAEDRLVEEERRLARIVDKKRRQHDPVPGGPDRISSDMPHIGVERLAPGDRQEDAAQNGKATPPALRQERDGMSRVDRGEHIGMAQDAAETEHRDHAEPEHHQGSEHRADAVLSRGPGRQKGRAGRQPPSA